MGRLRSEWDVKSHDVRAGEGLVCAFREFHFERLGAGGNEEGIVGDDDHSESLCAFGKLGADAAHAHDGEALTKHFHTLEGLAIPSPGDH